MSFFSRNANDVAQGQVAAILADTGRARAGRAAGRGNRSLGRREMVVPPATGVAQPVTGRTHRSIPD